MTRLTLVLFFSLLLIPLEAFAETGVTDKEILIGTSGGFTGQNASRVNALASGYHLYFRKVNARGGVYGRKIRIIAYDDNYKPLRTVENVRRLIERDKVFALFKIYGTPTLKAALPYIEKYDIPLLAPSSGAEFLRTPPHPDVFTTKPGHFEEAERGVKLLVEELGLKRIAVFYQQDSFGDSGRNGTRKSLQSRGLDLVSSGSYSQAYSQRRPDEVRTAVNEIMKGRPDAVFLFAIGGPALQFMDAAAKKGFHPVYVAQLALVSPEFQEGVKARGETVYMATAMPTIEDHSLAVSHEYINAATAAGERVTAGGMEGYVDAMILVEALKRAGPELTRSSLKRALEKEMTDLHLKGLRIQMSPKDHQALSKVYVAKIIDGRLVPRKGG